ncbi:inositol monophosphatase family protein [Dactylosporangium matsuzakiense]|uniref:Inositol-1-monophosphatase n=1 Tax=Dactylosporangium matsuzakiense TaxID=53360 RepID=A0A9W6NKQ4_9ACTN|nr:inositol monophosphatase family protein [Dactylosporangium matsuzakiense]UWZ45858.1 inositol monophosphatase [Dactylosporangium matsuzakiense]GLL00072.1 inositol monophosphatase [Dactylosporangium matsuzakiense]
MTNEDLLLRQPPVRQLDGYLDAAVRAARAAGRVVRHAFHQGRAVVEDKGPRDYVTEVDRAAEDLIRESLLRYAPAPVPFVGEESGGVVGSLCWVVDPLDGTTNFLRGYPSVGVSIALVHEGRPVVGVVHAPMWDETFTAVAGAGARRNGRPITVGTRPAARAVCSTGLPVKRPEAMSAYLDLLGRLLPAVEDLRRPAGASLDLAWVACGVFDAFFELDLGSWDVAAGALLVREAGGVVTDWSGDPDCWLDTGHIVAASPGVHATVLQHTRATVLPVLRRGR